ncbi:MAG: large conductance mechanosensitive channel protein MscL [Firmicutes bacterium HGW-Firmicutes-1]|jgi:large conductance mechanosensitive channel|nr:MAG: large conductance mechanosensitive channel protein MscL [Firmicutes bacterium HGW-Firmicutes-1]
MRNLIEEFKKFISRGNVIDLAVGLLIGSTFGKVVTSLVEDIITPPLGMLIGKVKFEDLEYIIPTSTVAIRYGAFIQSIVNFLIIGFSVFIVVKLMNRFIKKKEDVKPIVQLTRQEILLEEIRDLLRAKR